MVFVCAVAFVDYPSKMVEEPEGVGGHFGRFVKTCVLEESSTRVRHVLVSGIRRRLPYPVAVHPTVRVGSQFRPFSRRNRYRKRDSSPLHRSSATRTGQQASRDHASRWGWRCRCTRGRRLRRGYRKGGPPCMRGVEQRLATGPEHHRLEQGDASPRDCERALGGEVAAVFSTTPSREAQGGMP